MPGTVKGAKKRELGREPRNNTQVRINLPRDVLKVLQELADQLETTPADYVRDMIETRIARVRPEVFENINNITREVVA